MNSKGTVSADLAMASFYGERILNVLPDNHEAAFSVAMGYFVRGCFPEAEKALHKCLEITPGDPSLLIQLAKCQLVQGKLIEARMNAGSAFSIAPDSQEIRRVLEEIAEAEQLMDPAEGICSDESEFQRWNRLLEEYKLEYHLKKAIIVYMVRDFARSMMRRDWRGLHFHLVMFSHLAGKLDDDFLLMRCGNLKRACEACDEEAFNRNFATLRRVFVGYIKGREVLEFGTVSPPHRGCDSLSRQRL